MKKYTSVLWCFLVLLLPSVVAAQTVEIRDTSVQRGMVFPVDVRVRDIPAGASIRLSLTYDRFLLLYSGAEGGGERIMQCATPEVVVTSGDTERRLTITCSNIRPSTDGVLLRLYFEALAGPDSVARIRPDSIAVDGVDVQGVLYDDARVVIPGIPVFPQPDESLSQNYPNPFNLYTLFRFTLPDEEAPVRFHVFTLAGRLVPEEDYTLQQNEETLSLTPGFRMANGAYLMQMETDNGVYQVPFFFIR